MTEQNYDEQMLVEYLLGSLPEAEAVRLDELSFTNDDFNARLESVEKDLVDLYARGEMSGAMLEKFNSHYLASPRRRELTEFAQAFQIFARQAAVKSVAPIVAQQKKELIDAAASPSASRWWSVLKFPAVSRPVWQWSLAAVALVLLITGGWLLFENLRPRSNNVSTEAQQREQKSDERRLTNLEPVRESAERAPQQQPEQQSQESQRAAEQQRSNDTPQIARLHPSPSRKLNIVSFDLAPQTRGVGSLVTLSIPAKANRVVLRLALETGAFPVCRVVLRNQADNKIVWRSGNLKPKIKGDGKILSVALSAGLLKLQVYSLEVSGVTADGVTEFISGYSFRVVQ